MNYQKLIKQNFQAADAEWIDGDIIDVAVEFKADLFVELGFEDFKKNCEEHEEFYSKFKGYDYFFHVNEDGITWLWAVMRCNADTRKKSIKACDYFLMDSETGCHFDNRWTFTKELKKFLTPYIEKAFFTLRGE